ncbi:mucin-12-like isoform X2 [Salmo trutta]|uniref:mucin-12-like isoform X2 n=1 Tax=Salmo trutta TaxID=8032 RepID=UPI001131E574|nr:mucin-12-like isoform X2 [Salmo trutta]
MEELSESPTALVFEGGISPAVLANDVSERAPSETSVEGAEASERHTSLSVSPQTSFVSAHSEESLKAKDLSPPSSLARIPSAHLSDGVSPAVSARCSASDLLERASSETTKPRVIPSAPSMDELLVLPTASVVGISTAVSARSSRGSFAERAPSETTVEGVKYSESGLSGRPFSETELVDAAHRVSSVRIPSREESVRRTAETPERHSSPRVSPQTSSVSATRMSSKPSLSRVPSVSLSDGAAESVSMEVISNVEDIYTAPSVEQIVSSTAAVVGISPAASARCSSNDMSGRTCFEAAVVGAEIPEKHTSPKVSPQTSLMSAHVGESMRGTDISPKSSLDRISSIGERAAESASREVMYMEEMYKASMAELPGPPAAVGGISQTVSARCSQGDMAERAPSETVVGRDTSSRVSPRVSPQTSVSSATGLSSKFSLARVPSVSLRDGATEPAQIDNETLSMEELMTSPLYSHWSPAGSESDLLGLKGAPSETAVDGAHRGFLVTIPSREESVMRTAETPERDTSPSVSPQTSFTGVVSDVTVFYRDSSVGELHLSPSVGEELVVEAYELPSLEKKETPSTSVGRLSPVVSARYTGSGLTRRAFSEKEVTRPETPDRHMSPRLSPRVSPQSSLTRISSAPTMEEPRMSPTASVGRLSPAVSSVRYSGRGLSGRPFSETELVDAAHRVSSVRIPSREESVRRTAETPERHTSPRVFPRSSQRVSPQTSLISAHVGESLSGTDISPQFSLPRIPFAPSMDRPTSPIISQRVSLQSSLSRIPSAPSMEELLVSPSTSVGRMSPAVSRRSSKSSLSERAPSETIIRYSESCLSGRAFSETKLVDAAHRVSSVRIPSREESVRRTAEIPERHLSPRVSPRMSPRTSPQSSLARIPSAPSMEEPLVSSTASVCRIPPAATVEAAHREESVARTAEAPESHTTHRVSFRIYPQTSKTSVLSDVAVLYSPSMTAGFRLEVLDMECDQVYTSVSDITAKVPSDTAAMKTIHRESSGRIPSREEIVRRTAETQTSHASGVLDNSTQVSQTAIRLCEKIIMASPHRAFLLEQDASLLMLSLPSRITPIRSGHSTTWPMRQRRAHCPLKLSPSLRTMVVLIFATLGLDMCYWLRGPLPLRNLTPSPGVANPNSPSHHPS